MRVARGLGVEYTDKGIDRGFYEVELRNPTPRQMFFIGFAPVLLAVVSVASFMIGWILYDSHFWYSLVFFLIGFGSGRFAPPSVLDFSSVFFIRSWSQPVSSVLSSLVALPLLLVRLPCILYPRYNLVLDWGVAAALFYGSFLLHMRLGNVLSLWGVYCC